MKMNIKEKEIDQLKVNQLKEQLINIDTNSEDILSSEFQEIRYYTRKIEELESESIFEINQQSELLC